MIVSLPLLPLSLDSDGESTQMHIDVQTVYGISFWIVPKFCNVGSLSGPDVTTCVIVPVTQAWMVMQNEWPLCLTTI
jgi:hypothetical protein